MNRIKELRKKYGIRQTELCSQLGITQGALSGWENEKYEPDHKSLKKMAEIFHCSIDFLLGMPEQDYLYYDNVMPIKTHRIPLLGEIACGQPIYAEEQLETYVEVGGDIQADFCLRAKGDSMINARIQDGDIVFIRKQPDVENGEIAAVLIEDEATLKRVYKTARTVTLVAENPAYAPLVYSESDCVNILILGKAVAFQSKVK